MAQLPWLCAGDFNEVLTENEKLGGVPRNRVQIENFREALDFCGLDDFGFRGSLFTWCNKRNGIDSVQKRLDRGNFDWNQLFPRAIVNHLKFWYSDH